MRGGRLLSLLPTALLVAALVMAEEPWAALILLFAVVLHESGHITAAVLLGAGTPMLRGEVGGLLLASPRPLGRGGEAVVAMAGPLANLLCAIVTLGLWRITGRGVWLFTLSVVNLLTALCNLLPLRGSDGGRLLRLLAERILGARGARLADALSLCLAGTLYFTSVYLFYVGVTGLAFPLFSAATLFRVLSEEGKGSGSIRE